MRVHVVAGTPATFQISFLVSLSAGFLLVFGLVAPIISVTSFGVFVFLDNRELVREHIKAVLRGWTPRDDCEADSWYYREFTRKPFGIPGRRHRSWCTFVNGTVADCELFRKFR